MTKFHSTLWNRNIIIHTKLMTTITFQLNRLRILSKTSAIKTLLSLLQTSRSSSLDDGKTVFLATKNQTAIRQLLHRPAPAWWVPKCDVTKKIVKLWDLVPFSNRASLEKGPCQKLPLKCNSQPKYKGWKFDTAPYKSLILSWLKDTGQILKGLYGMLSNFDPLYYISIGNCNSELVFGMSTSLRILYKYMISYPIISKKIIYLWRHHFVTLCYNYWSLIIYLDEECSTNIAYAQWNNCKRQYSAVW